MMLLRQRFWFVVLLLVLTVSARAQTRTENVILITLDGVRTQEIFAGLDFDVLKATTKRGKAEDTPLYKKYWAETSERRREKLLIVAFES